MSFDLNSVVSTRRYASKGGSAAIHYSCAFGFQIGVQWGEKDLVAESDLEKIHATDHTYRSLRYFGTKLNVKGILKQLLRLTDSRGLDAAYVERSLNQILQNENHQNRHQNINETWPVVDRGPNCPSNGLPHMRSYPKMSSPARNKLRNAMNPNTTFT